jgi:hypothetical protein
MERPTVVLATVRVEPVYPSAVVALTRTFLRHRHFPWGLSHLFLMVNVVVRLNLAGWRL